MALSGKEKVSVYIMGLLLGTLILMIMPRGERSSDKTHWHEQTAVEGYYPYLIKDALGREVVLDDQPRHFISLAPSVTETLFAMGMGDHLQAVTQWCNYPVEARALKNAGAHIGAMDQPNRERIAEYRPDLILGSKLTPREVYEVLESSSRADGVALAWDRLDEIRASIKKVGQLIGVPGKALELTQELEQRWAAAKALVKSEEGFGVESRSALFLLGIESGEQAGWVAGKDTWVGDLMESAGLSNAGKIMGSSWGELSFENLLKLNPDYLLIRGNENGNNEQLMERIAKLKTHSVWKNISAVKSDRIIILSYGPFTIPGPRYVEAFESLAKGLREVDSRGEKTGL